MRSVLLLLAFVTVGCGGGPASAESSVSPVVADSGSDSATTQDGGVDSPSTDAAPTPDAEQDSAPACEYTSSPPAYNTNDECLSDDPTPTNLCPCGAGYRYRCGDPATLNAPINVQGCTTLTQGAETIMCCTQLAGSRVQSHDSACESELGFPRGFYYPAGALAPMGLCKQRTGLTCCQ